MLQGIGVWCNGNTADSGPAFPGSSPGTPTKVLKDVAKKLFATSFLSPYPHDRLILFSQVNNELMPRFLFQPHISETEMKRKYPMALKGQSSHKYSMKFLINANLFCHYPLLH